ncbi:EpsG family protein [Sulfurimonas sp. HSL1-2]|uniref:EpsG family protein n=1 Tax=Thiomicrolovo zhangzhouensis TaxID=3131933 RepID=UPI0031F8A82D
MLAYYLMFLVPALAAIMTAGKGVRPNNAVWISTGMLLTLLLGFRMSGGDWYNYLSRFDEMRYLTLDLALGIKDPGYQLISYYMYQWDWGFYAVTMICAVISVTGLMIFLRRQVDPWLGLAVAVPYLYIVVYMGYMRQGVALGLVMWGITFLERGKFVRFVLMVVLAVTFHKSAILMIAFGVFQQGKGRIFKILAILFAGVGVWSAFVGDAAETLYVNYVEAGMQSGGAMIRVLLNAVPAMLLMLYRKQWKQHFNDYGFWSMIALASLAAIPLVVLASTAVDRMALYFLPLQIVVFARLPFLMRDTLSQQITTFLILLFYFTVLTVWLTLGSFSKWWLPYKNFLIFSMFG